MDSAGKILGRPTLSIVVDTYSGCIMGMHLGFDAPSASVVCLVLRHAILPKQYSSAYELLQSWTPMDCRNTSTRMVEKTFVRST